MKKRFNGMKLSEQIILYYLFLFLVIIVVCMGLYLFSSNKHTETMENNNLEYGLQIANSNMQILFENVANCSKSIAYSKTIQKALSSNVKIGYEERLAIQEEIIQNMACFDGISSVYLFDNTGNSYVAGEIDDVEMIRKHLIDYSYFETTFEEQGRKNSISNITFTVDEEIGGSRQKVSFVRRVSNLNTMENIGILVINIPITKITEMINAICAQTGIEITLLNSESNEIFSSQNGGWIASEAVEGFVSPEEENYKEIKQKTQKYRIGAIQEKNQAWIIMGAIARNVILSDMQQSLIISFILLVMGVISCIVGASYITTKIARPLSNILVSMEHIRNNRLERVNLLPTNFEIDNLQQRYNQMLDEIEKLMSQKVEEQRLRKKYELSLLQEQIKPHFLYNTFDSVCALAKMGRTEDVYTMMQALGQYYRGSLHKGQTLITIREELNIVDNYLIIQSFRYDDVFEVVYDVEESVKSYAVIKLILQPLVENAIYHGFRENDLNGKIIIRAKDAGNYVKLQVEDDGIGMDEEKIKQQLNVIQDNQGKRFGLSGTIRRINLYYNHSERDLVEIKSECGKGTTITIWIPKEAGAGTHLQV